MDDTGQRIRIGMVGGGPGAGIAETHRVAMRMDDLYSLQAGVFSHDPERSRAFGRKLEIAQDRLYPDFAAMAKAEAQRPDCVEVVAITTPTDSHYRIAKTFLENGFALICEKPVTSRLEEALELYQLARDTQAIFALPHSYSAYAMVRQAARMVRDGELGEVRLVQVQHASGWAAQPLERTGHKQALWRMDPAIAGAASVVADLGTHAHHLLRYITGLEVTEVSAELSTVVPQRRVYDNAQVNLHLSNGARGMLWASMAATGNNHGLRIQVFGETASLEWHHADPHHLTVHYLDGSARILEQGGGGLAPEARRFRYGLGHPEGFLEAFANLYSDVAEALQARREGKQPAPPELGYPTVRDGVIGLRFVDAVSASHAAGGRWTDSAIEL